MRLNCAIGLLCTMVVMSGQKHRWNCWFLPRIYRANIVIKKPAQSGAFLPRNPGSRIRWVKIVVVQIGLSEVVDDLVSTYGLSDESHVSVLYNEYVKEPDGSAKGSPISVFHPTPLPFSRIYIGLLVLKQTSPFHRIAYVKFTQEH